jgi:acyl-CoA thioesterase
VSEGDARLAPPGFAADTAIEDLGDGRFAAAMSERWWVGKGPNGGYVAAVILRAIQAAGGERPPRSLTVHFQRSPAAGPVEVAVEIERQGSRVTFLSARMTQAGKVQATALAVLSEDWSDDGFSELRMPDAGAPGELLAVDPEKLPPNAPRMFQNYRARPALGEPAFSGGAPRNGAWIRTREPHLLDAPLAATFLDAWFPAPFIRLKGPRPAPTIDYTVHFRSPLPPAGATPEDAYLVAFRSNLARHGFFEEDGELWSADGTLLAQSRQLALLLDPTG